MEPIQGNPCSLNKWTGVRPVLCIFVLIFMTIFLSTGFSEQGFSCIGYNFFTFQLQGLKGCSDTLYTLHDLYRVELCTTQGDPCNLHRERVCSVFRCIPKEKWFASRIQGLFNDDSRSKSLRQGMHKDCKKRENSFKNFFFSNCL